MSWDRVSAMSSPSIRGAHVEADTLKLWHEFLDGWFQGTPVDILGGTEGAPLAKLTFQQAALIQPLDKDSTRATPVSNCGISVIWAKGARAKRRLRDASRISYQPASFTILVRAKGSNIGAGTAADIVTGTADLLFAILSDKSKTLPLARRGMGHIRADNPVAVASVDYYTRSMAVTAQLRYASGGEVNTPDVLTDGEGNTLIFGDFQWSY